MSPSRRSFLQKAAVSVFAANLPFAALAERNLNDRGESFNPDDFNVLDGLSLEIFEKWTGAKFRLSLNNKLLGTLVLVSATEIGTTKEASEKPGMLRTSDVRRVGAAPERSVAPALTSFSLSFEGTGPALPQDTYTLAHDWLGTFPLFLVPSGLSQGKPTYIAVFTLLNQPKSKKSE